MKTINQIKKEKKDFISPNAKHFLKSLPTYDSVWDYSADSEYTEEQLIDFAERYHKERMRDNSTLKLKRDDYGYRKRI